jgi:hypothetical protein
MSLSTSINWHGSAPKNPKNGDCFYNADESIVCVYSHGKWFNMGPLVDDMDSKMKQLFRDKLIEKIINPDEQTDIL